MSPTSAKVASAPLVAGGEPQRAEPIGECNPSLICEARSWRLSRIILSNWHPDIGIVYLCPRAKQSLASRWVAIILFPSFLSLFFLVWAENATFIFRPAHLLHPWFADTTNQVSYVLILFFKGILEYLLCWCFRFLFGESTHDLGPSNSSFLFN